MPTPSFQADPGTPVQARLSTLLAGFSIEVTPKSLARCAVVEDLFPAGTRVYIAHIHGTDIVDMVAAAWRLSGAGYEVMPHIPARSIRDRGELEAWIGRYRDAGVRQALLIAGGRGEPVGALTSSIDLIETGLFEAAGFGRIHVAGHPEGNRETDPSGGDRIARESLLHKQAWARSAGIEMAIVTQFMFDAPGLLRWAGTLAADGIALPVHAGVAGPTRLQSLLRFAMSCGVGPSLGVLKRRATDITKLLKPYDPLDFVESLARDRSAGAGANIERVHFFPLGGIAPCRDWLLRHHAFDAEPSGDGRHRGVRDLSLAAATTRARPEGR